MSTRHIAALLLAALTAACANDRSPSALGISSGLGAADIASARLEPPAKTLSSRVLAAIALEQVTGRRPDPARLAGGE